MSKKVYRKKIIVEPVPVAFEEMVSVNLVKKLIYQQEGLQALFQKQERELVFLRNKLEKMFLLLDAQGFLPGFSKIDLNKINPLEVEKK